MILDFGSANHCRFLDVSQIVEKLEKKRDGVRDALLGCHPLTGCDYTSSCFLKGRIKPFTMLEDLKTIRYLRTLASNEGYTHGFSEFICNMYGHSGNITNEWRHKAFLKVTEFRGKIATLKHVKKT